MVVLAKLSEVRLSQDPVAAAASIAASGNSKASIENFNRHTPFLKSHPLIAALRAIKMYTTPFGKARALWRNPTPDDDQISVPESGTRNSTVRH
jgi:hypothetical protein